MRSRVKRHYDTNARSSSGFRTDALRVACYLGQRAVTISKKADKKREFLTRPRREDRLQLQALVQDWQRLGSKPRVEGWTRVVPVAESWKQIRRGRHGG